MKTSLIALFVGCVAPCRGLSRLPKVMSWSSTSKRQVFWPGKSIDFVFDRFEGRLDESRVTMTIDAASIRCVDTWVSANDLKKIEKTARTEMLDVSPISFTEHSNPQRFAKPRRTASRYPGC